jgi:hypothetical protein
MMDIVKRIRTNPALITYSRYCVLIPGIIDLHTLSS